ncbi:MAG: hypothetical protein ACXWO1_17360 [Isosphaeraceae bacterium]
MLPFRRVPLAWANLVHNKVKLAASLAGITFAVALMFMEMGFYNQPFQHGYSAYSMRR